MYDGSIIKQLRSKKNMSQAELAELLGCSQRNVSSYETTRTRPDIDVLSKLADIFNVSTDYILGRSEINTDSLNENEIYILKTFRNLRPETQIEFLTTVSMVKALRDTQKRIEGK